MASKIKVGIDLASILGKKKEKRKTEALKDAILLSASQRLKDDPERFESFQNVLEKIPNSVSSDDLLKTIKTLQPGAFETPGQRLISRGKQASALTSIAEAEELGLVTPPPDTGQRISQQTTGQPSNVREAIGGGQPIGQTISQAPTQPRSAFTPIAKGPLARKKEIAARAEIFKQREKKELETVNKVSNAVRISNRNVELVSNSLSRLAKTYSDAVLEGGIGDVTKAARTGFAKFTGGKLANQLPASLAFPGQKTEVITKMMPLLTQQGEKEGSVRLVSTVFDRLIETLPGESTPPIPARRQMAETIGNMLGFSKVMKELKINNKTVEGMSDEQLKSLGSRIENFNKSLDVSPEEQEATDDFINKALEPMWPSIFFKTPQEAQDAVDKNLIPKGAFINVGGRKARVD